ncbi:ABC transporter ATP-binding protein [Paenibacillus thalictri]|uniref:ABC transporter ATP-binding protein n=1 Tax=Paenibacillus thalictri TaxID=2527873 RepID=A0A4Q9DLZ4_9BACL|nr:ABC transporter ATP-binding protein [Paenibacillus thalictri]TBL75618.1 ABC transporter ATP-binding protein [Paenibacillus thalictri]
MTEKLLQVRNLVTEFTTGRGTQRVVDGISFDIEHGQTVGLVGESGSGKSITSLSVMGLIKAPGRIAGGSIRFAGEELTDKSVKQLRKIRGKDISMIFQEPMTSLNPVLTVGEQIAETVRLHEGLSAKAAEARALDMLTKVGIPMAETRIKQYPHQLSGGMRQRVMIAIALSCSPKLLIADEPTTALDVTIQAQILELMKSLKQEAGMGVLMVTHDLGVVAEICEKVIVMYAGQIVEEGPVDRVFVHPQHPYTEALLKSIPSIAGGRGKLYSIPGNVPALHAMPQHCRFHTRCPYVFERCMTETPQLTETEDGRKVSCWKPSSGVELKNS